MMKARYAESTEVFKKKADFAVNKGNAETFQDCQARLLQRQKEMKEMLTTFADESLSVNVVSMSLRVPDVDYQHYALHIMTGGDRI